MPVFLDENYILTTPDVPIAEELKNRLQKWGYTTVQTEGTPQDPTQSQEKEGEGGSAAAAPATAVLESNIKEQQSREAAMKFFLECAEFLQYTFTIYLERNIININTITEKMKEMITFIKENRKYILRFGELVSPKHSQIVSQSIKTTIVALVLADVLKLPVFKQIEVGIAGFLHDIGMLRIPKEIYMKEGALTEEEKKAIITHPVIGFRILKEVEFPMAISRAVLEHQEKENGSGYPRGLTGDKISFYAKILAVASSYVAIVSDRPYRDAVDGHAGIMDLLKNSGKQYDEQIIRVLVFTLSIYPIGTFVLLSNGSQGIVVETNPKDPKFPVVKLLLSEEGVSFKEQPVLNTRDGSDGIHVVRPLTNNEIQELQTQIQ
jgi:HD-GYP domain-containing protein (c-di-GMP phosphodiesterase class II)